MVIIVRSVTLWKNTSNYTNKALYLKKFDFNGKNSFNQWTIEKLLETWNIVVKKLNCFSLRDFTFGNLWWKNIEMANGFVCVVGFSCCEIYWKQPQWSNFILGNVVLTKTYFLSYSFHKEIINRRPHCFSAMKKKL